MTVYEQVMDQVRREAENDPKLKKAFEEVEKTASKVTGELDMWKNMCWRQYENFKEISGNSY